MTLLAPSSALRPAVAPPIAALDGVSKRYGRIGGVLALANVSFTVPAGQFLCLLGPSGCGKSTVLSLLAGLEQPTTGSVSVADPRPALMFQDAALFPWLTVAENIAFPLRLRRLGKGERRARLAELVRLVRLEGFENRRPHELSGGMRQRVALARALAQDAGLLLMDEPFGSLDALLRARLHDELEALWQARGLTIVFVTHDVREAVRLADRVLVFTPRPGRIAADITIDLPRPRHAEGPDCAELAAAIAAHLHLEFANDDPA